ncbi:hypothetical protein WN944_007223 [Citrus x changshan-huyou]|uniref:Uncharacterized protein n=1 Tax=Citrus x changshan-huyou TaxID=2935761 RepID=A0AAP0QUL0_9ROSI
MGKSCMEKPGDCAAASVMQEILLFEEMLACESNSNQGETKSEEGSRENINGQGEEKEDQNGNDEVEKSSDDNGLQ